MDGHELGAVQPRRRHLLERLGHGGGEEADLHAEQDRTGQENANMEESVPDKGPGWTGGRAVMLHGQVQVLA